MKLLSLINEIEKDFPLEFQEEWDCAGLLLENEKVTKIVVCLDITKKIENFALNNDIDMIISHHPLIFRDYCDSFDYIREIYQSLYSRKIAIYSMHTNYDNHPIGMNTQFINKIGYERIDEESTLLSTFYGDNNLLKNLNEVIKYPLRIYNAQPNVDKVAVLLGSGGSLIEEAKQKECNVFISSEFKHHEILYAVENGITLIDVAHQAEKIFVEDVAKYLSNKFEDIEVYSYKDSYNILDVLPK